MATIESFFKNEEFKAVLNYGKKVAKAKAKILRDRAIYKFNILTNPHLRLAEMVRSGYDAFRKAEYSHEEALNLSSESMGKTIERTLEYLNRTEDSISGKKEERTCR